MLSGKYCKHTSSSVLPLCLGNRAFTPRDASGSHSGSNAHIRCAVDLALAVAARAMA
jgi:hypothetical protein